MAKSKPYCRLSVKLVFMLLVSAVISVALGLAVSLLGNYLVSNVYSTPQRQERRTLQAISSFRDFVAGENIASTDVEEISRWNREHPDVRLSISANGIWVNSDRSGAELLKTDSGLLLRTQSREISGQAYAVNFSDGAYQVQLQEYSEMFYYNLTTVSSFTLAGLTFLILMLLYNRQVTLSITHLAGRVRHVSQGDLSMEIPPTSNDEIGDLAQDVDHMRLSILDKLKREEEAWMANSQLITAMSHDVRTPLTTLMGYLELLSQEDFPEEQRKAYLELCCRKAEKLRELTDELFSYSMVFGKAMPETQPETYDAQLLLEQLLGEHEAELLAEGYQVQAARLAEPGTIEVDLQYLRRGFDNLFSNIRKYADQARPVTMAARWEGQFLLVTLGNHLADHAGKVESTRIGLRTCEKLMDVMGGEFTREQTRETFTVHVRIPGKRG